MNQNRKPSSGPVCTWCRPSLEPYLLRVLVPSPNPRESVKCCLTLSMASMTVGSDPCAQDFSMWFFQHTSRSLEMLSWSDKQTSRKAAPPAPSGLGPARATLNHSEACVFLHVGTARCRWGNGQKGWGTWNPTLRRKPQLFRP